MSGSHEIVWTFDDDRVVAEVVCKSTPESPCRWEPHDDACQCEAYYGSGVDADGPYHLAFMVDDADGSESEVKHRMRYGGECGVRNWMNDDPSTIPESAEADGTFEIGRTAFEPAWQGDYYTWERVTK